MTENKEQDKGKKLGLARPGKLELKKTELFEPKFYPMIIASNSEFESSLN